MGCDKSLTDNDFRRIAKQEIVKWWNSNEQVIGEYGTINIADICTIWQCLTNSVFEAFHKVTFDGEGYYFEFVYDMHDDNYSLNVYKRI